MGIEDIELVKTCSACPEQYDAFIKNKQVGYLRLRHGRFRVDYPSCGIETIYESFPDGDGMFEDYEQGYFLYMAKKAILNKIKQLHETNNTTQ